MAALEAKLVQLNMAKNRTANILKANDYEKIKTQQGTLKDLVRETKINAKIPLRNLKLWRKLTWKRSKRGTRQSKIKLTRPTGKWCV